MKLEIKTKGKTYGFLVPPLEVVFFVGEALFRFLTVRFRFRRRGVAVEVDRRLTEPTNAETCSIVARIVARIRTFSMVRGNGSSTRLLKYIKIC